MPLAFECGGSVFAPAVRIDTSTEPARLGSAMHEALRPLAEGGSVPWETLSEMAIKYAVDADDLRVVVSGALRLWKLVGETFPGAVTEVPLSMAITPDATLSGHIDILSVTGKVAHLGDWKSGYRDHNYRDQMMAYGTLVLADDRAIDSVQMTVLWARVGDVERYSMNREDARAWVKLVRDEVLGWNGTFRPAPSRCDWCPRTFECPAARAQLQKDVAAVLALPELVSDLTQLPPRAIFDLLHRAKQLATYAERIPAYVKAHVLKHGDVVDGDDEDAPRLFIQDGTKREADVLRTWAVLEDSEGFTTPDFAQVLTISLGDVEDIVAKRAGKGMGAAAVRALGEKLIDAEAVRLIPTTRLSEKKGRKGA